LKNYVSAHLTSFASWATENSANGKHLLLLPSTKTSDISKVGPELTAASIAFLAKLDINDLSAWVFYKTLGIQISTNF
jgi:hypothetical protein